MGDTDEPDAAAPPVDPDTAPDDSAPDDAAPGDSTDLTVGRRSSPWSGAQNHRTAPDVLAAIAAGGMLGAAARYGVAQLVHVGAGGFPWATFWTNLSGSLLLGVLLVVLVERRPPSRHLRPFLATGVIGAYTTFSTFAVEVDLLVRDGRLPVAGAYVAATVVLGLAAVGAGIMMGRHLPYGGRHGVPVRPAAPGPLGPSAALGPPAALDPLDPERNPGRNAGPPRPTS